MYVAEEDALELLLREVKHLVNLFVEEALHRKDVDVEEAVAVAVFEVVEATLVGAELVGVPQKALVAVGLLVEVCGEEVEGKVGASHQRLETLKHSNRR